MNYLRFALFVLIVGGGFVTHIHAATEQQLPAVQDTVTQVRTELNDLLPELALCVEQVLQSSADRLQYKFTLSKSHNSALIDLVKQGAVINNGTAGAIMLTSAIILAFVSSHPIFGNFRPLVFSLAFVLGIVGVLLPKTSFEGKKIPLLSLNHRKITIDQFGSFLLRNLKAVSYKVGIDHANDRGVMTRDENRAYFTITFKNGFEKQLELPVNVAVELSLVLNKIIKLLGKNGEVADARV